MLTLDPKLSIVKGKDSPPLYNLTLSQLIDQQAAKYGSKDAVIIGWSNARLSYQDLSQRTTRLARSLLALGVKKNDRVAILSGDDERFIELFFATARVGACLTIINKTYTTAEALRALEHIGSSHSTNGYRAS